jgi:hypothetical protein
VVAAPAIEPGRRATTLDTYEWLTGPAGGVRPGERVLIVTTHIYVYQGVEAVRTLGVPHGVDVEWVGIRPGDVHPDLKQNFKTHNYLQEIRSMISALRRLHTAIS